MQEPSCATYGIKSVSNNALNKLLKKNVRLNVRLVLSDNVAGVQIKEVVVS